MTRARVMPTNVQPKYVNECVISARFGIPVATLRTRRNRGGGPPFRKLGRRVLYDIVEVGRWFELNSVKVEEPDENPDRWSAQDKRRNRQ